MLKQYTFLLFMILSIQNSSCVIFGILQGALKAWKMVSTIDNIALSFDTGKRNNETLAGITSETELLLHELLSIEKKLDEFKFSNTYKSNLISELKDGVDINQKKGQIVSFMSSIDEKYIEFMEHMKNNASSKILDDFTLSFLINSVESLHNFRSILIPNIKYEFIKSGFFNEISTIAFRKRGRQCEEQQTIQYFLMNLFQMAITTEVKTMVMLAFSKRWRYSQEAGWKPELEDLREFADRMMAYASELSGALKNVESLYFNTCDPEGGAWVINKSFYEFDGLFQLAIFKYPTMYLRERTFCAPVGKEEVLNPSSWLGGNICTGIVSSCKPLGPVKACLLNRLNPHKYKWVMRGWNSPWEQNYDSCPGDNVHSARVRMFDGWVSCSCQCSNSRYRVYLGAMESRINSNYVIVGLRFIRNNGVLYLQPAEAKLEPNGHVSNRTWVPLERNWEGKIQGISRNTSTFFLNDLRLPVGYALTGVKFNLTHRGEKKRMRGFEIGIIGVPFNYETGELNLTPEKKLIYNSPPSIPETELILKPVSSITMNPYAAHIANSQKYTYVKLQQTTIDDDFGQTTLPFLDIQPLQPNPPSPLGGFGLFHKGFKDRAGFISLRLYSIDYLGLATEFINEYKDNPARIWNYTKV